MEIKELQDKIEKKKIAIEKLNKKIEKLHSKIPEQIWNATKDLNYSQRNQYEKDHNVDYKVMWDIGDLQSAYISLEAYKLTLQKYENMLIAAQVKANQLENNKIQVVWDFLQNWKKEVLDYIKKYQIPLVQKYYELRNEEADYFNTHRSDEDRKEKLDDYKIRLRDLRSQIMGLVENHSFGKNVDLEAIEKVLDKDVENKYFNLIDQVTKYTGEITDVSHLRIGEKGTLDGFVIGKDGKAKVQTVGAGGEHTHEIVNVKHGQIFHWRCIVNKIK